jgi:hypothetical protein
MVSSARANCGSPMITAMLRKVFMSPPFALEGVQR